MSNIIHYCITYLHYNTAILQYMMLMNVTIVFIIIKQDCFWGSTYNQFIHDFGNIDYTK